MSNGIDWTAYLARCRETISPRANTAQLRELMFALGLAGEAGEVAEVVKKAHFHEMDDDQARAKILDESGDMLWYWIQLLDMYEVTINEVIEHNIEKLQRRHSEGHFKAGYTSDTVASQRNLVLVYGLSGDIDNYIAEKIKAKRHDHEMFYVGVYNNIEIIRAFANGYEVVYVDAERSNIITQHVVRIFESRSVIVKTVNVPPSKLELS